MTDGTELATFAGGVSVRRHEHMGFRGRGTVAVGAEGIEFALSGPFGRIAHTYVKRADLACVYPVQARRLSMTSLAAAIAPRMSNTAVRFLTPPVGMFADRDVYSCSLDNGMQPKLIELLEELGYPVDRKVKTHRLNWGDEV